MPGLLREGVLEGVTVAVAAAGTDRADAGRAPLARAVCESAAALGAGTALVALSAGDGAEAGEAEAERELAAALEQLGSLRALVVDARGAPGSGGFGRAELDARLAAAWNAARMAAQLAMLDGGGRIVLFAPAGGSGEHAPAAAAALENLARTLSIEWARHGVTVVAVAPGADTSDAELATLACWLLSPAGAYFSGCLMDLRGP